MPNAYPGTCRAQSHKLCLHGDMDLSTSMSGPPSLRIAECTPYLKVSGLRRTWSCRLGTEHSQAQAFHPAAANEQKPCVFNQSLETTNLRTTAQYHQRVPICSSVCVSGGVGGHWGDTAIRGIVSKTNVYLIYREYWFGYIFHDILSKFVRSWTFLL